ncbi:hypothetical protein BDV96DRAFT_60402 [Lophiotrema nucula]|uniref:Uncharacterized protein n=1 Tax=Lophiotrema nucula TaxID=690887 RepID=A0A6A5Z8M6_9PLEO|nr:hypothetical protein BDV96DRAFT_60402 [Lophiotrema nucula]
MTNLGLRIELPLHTVRYLGGIYLAELAFHHKHDYTGSLGIHVRAMKNNHFGRVHARDFRSPVLVEPQSIYQTSHAAIFLRKDSIVHGAEEIDRRHGILVRVHEPFVDGYQIAKVSPQDHWKKTKGNSAVMLYPTQYNVVFFKDSLEREFALLLNHESVRSPDKGAIYDTWEPGRGRCRFVQYSSSWGWEFFDEPSNTFVWKFLEDNVRASKRESFIARTLRFSSSKTFIDLPDNRRVVAGMKKNTIMGERMIAVDINFYDDSEGLYELHGEYIPRIPPTDQDLTSLAQDGLPPSTMQQSETASDESIDTLPALLPRSTMAPSPSSSIVSTNNKAFDTGDVNVSIG